MLRVPNYSASEASLGVFLGDFDIFDIRLFHGGGVDFFLTLSVHLMCRSRSRKMPNPGQKVPPAVAGGRGVRLCGALFVRLCFAFCLGLGLRLHAATNTPNRFLAQAARVCCFRHRLSRLQRLHRHAVLFRQFVFGLEEA